MVVFNKKISICLIVLFISVLGAGCKKQPDKNFIGQRSEYNRFIKENHLEQKADYVLSKGSKNDKF